MPGAVGALEDSVTAISGASTASSSASSASSASASSNPNAADAGGHRGRRFVIYAATRGESSGDVVTGGRIGRPRERLSVSAVDGVFYCGGAVGRLARYLGSERGCRSAGGRKGDVGTKGTRAPAARRRYGHASGTRGRKHGFVVDPATRGESSGRGIGTREGVSGAGIGLPVSAFERVDGRRVGGRGRTRKERGRTCRDRGGRDRGGGTERIGNRRNRLARNGVAGFSRAEARPTRILGIAGFLGIDDAVAAPPGINIEAFAVFVDVRGIEAESEVPPIGDVHDVRDERRVKIRTVDDVARIVPDGTADHVGNLRYAVSPIGGNEIREV